MEPDTQLIPLREATAVFMARLLVAMRDGVTIPEISVVTGLTGTMIHCLVISATEAQ